MLAHVTPPRINSSAISAHCAGETSPLSTTLGDALDDLVEPVPAVVAGVPDLALTTAATPLKPYMYGFHQALIQLWAAFHEIHIVD